MRMVKPRVAVPGSRGLTALTRTGTSSASAMLEGTDISTVSPAMLSEIGIRAPARELSVEGIGFLCRGHWSEVRRPGYFFPWATFTSHQVIASLTAVSQQYRMGPTTPLGCTRCAVWWACHSRCDT